MNTIVREGDLKTIEFSKPSAFGDGIYAQQILVSVADGEFIIELANAKVKVFKGLRGDGEEPL